MKKITLKDALNKGISAHKVGNLILAEKYYQEILKVIPHQPDANHNMGVLRVDTGKLDQAVSFFMLAINVNPEKKQYWLSAIDSLIKVRDFATAKHLLSQAKLTKFHDEEFHEIEENLIGQSSLLLGDELDEVEHAIDVGNVVGAKNKMYEQLKISPQDSAVYSKLAYCFILEGDFEQAFLQNEEAKKYDSDNPACKVNDIRLEIMRKNYVNAKNVAKSFCRQYVDSSDGLCLLGKCFEIEGDDEKALSFFDKAVEVTPNGTEALLSRGLLHRKLNYLDRATEDLEKVISLKPHLRRALKPLASMLFDMQSYSAAAKCVLELTYQNPRDWENWYALGICKRATGDVSGAIIDFNIAISLRPDNPAIKRQLGSVLTGISFNKPVAGLSDQLLGLLSFGSSLVRPKDISKAVISHIKFESAYVEASRVVSEGEASENCFVAINKLSSLQLLLKLMRLCPLPDVELEILLTELRMLILWQTVESKINLESLEFQNALAEQCFLNDYIYNESSTEKELVKRLRKKIKQDFETGTALIAQEVFCLASYRLIKEEGWCTILDDYIVFRELKRRQIDEVKTESNLRMDMDTNGEVRDVVSEKVRNQYEEFPYPKWINLGLDIVPKTVFEHIDALELNMNKDAFPSSEKIEILVAGCGTGQHSIATAARYKNSNIIAIDLSLASLAYAKRKTEELGIENIQYIRSDILEINQMKKKFDIVEAGGVLHHMENPFDGWKILVDILETGGLMRIGLYSQLARQHIVRIREKYCSNGIRLNRDEKINIRNLIMQSKDPDNLKLRQSSDFYSLPELTDLLFHVKEHTFSLPKIKGHLLSLGLKFCGFEDRNIRNRFKISNGGSEDMQSLDKWHNFEIENPDTFTGMYQFWCQKI